MYITLSPIVGIAGGIIKKYLLFAIITFTYVEDYSPGYSDYWAQCYVHCRLYSFPVPNKNKSQIPVRGSEETLNIQTTRPQYTANFLVKKNIRGIKSVDSLVF
jgi:hypothetical protein